MARRNTFTHMAQAVSTAAGRASTFMVASALIIVWLVTGPVFGFSDTWQLIINTSTTIVTFLMVFLIQNSQNRDSHAIHLKLDELIRAVATAHNALLDLEELSDDELVALRARFCRLAEDARGALRAGGKDTNLAELPEEQWEDHAKGSRKARKAAAKSLPSATESAKQEP